MRALTRTFSGNGAQDPGFRVSFEFFPPKSTKMEETLGDTIEKLAALQPDFVSVTYGAGGSTREPTRKTLQKVIETRSTPAAAHITCVDASRAEVDDVVRDFMSLGIGHFVALRGDPASGVDGRYEPHPGGYRNAAHLVEGLRALGVTDISVAAYPEKHPESRDFAADIEMLKSKVDAGATRAITQFFFDNDTYVRYLDRVRAAAIDVPVIPGIVPIHNFKAIRSFAARCGTDIPDWLAERFDGLDEDPQTHALVAAAVAAEQVFDLVERGVEDFHFYTMNRPDLVFAICRLLGIRAEPENGGSLHAA